MTEFLNSLTESELLRVAHLKKHHPVVREKLDKVEITEILERKRKERPPATFKHEVPKK